MDDSVIIENYAPFTYDLYPSSDISIHFDWFSFTFPVFDDIEDMSERQYLDYVIETICNMLGFDFNTEITYFPYSQNRYKETWQMGVNTRFRAFSEVTRLKVDNKMYQSCQFEITGAGCREIEKRLKVNWIDLWLYITNALKGKCKRIDIAIDDIKGDKIKLSEIKWFVENEKYTSKYFRNLNNPPLFMGTLKNGFSITFGSHDGNQLCIYDKDSQLASKFGDKVYNSYYVRYEMRFKDKRANDLISKPDLLPFYLKNNEDGAVGRFCMEQLYAMLDIKEKNDYGKANQCRVKTLDKWTNFLGVVENSKFSLSKGFESTLFSKKNWFMKNMSGMLLTFGMSNIFNDKETNYADSFVGMFIEFLKELKTKIKDEKYQRTYLPVIKDYLISNCSYDHTRNIKDDIPLIISKIDDVLNDFVERYVLPF